MPPPLLWVIEGAQAYHVIGLKHEAITESERPLIPERMQLTRWRIEVGQFQEAVHELTALKRRLKSIHEYIKRARLLRLASVMDRYHGLSPSPSLQKCIEKIAASNRWSDPLSDDPALRALEKNIRGTWALLHLDPTEAQKWYQPDPDMDDPHTVALRANLWLSYLYQRAPVEAILPIIQIFSIAELTPYQ